MNQSVNHQLEKKFKVADYLEEAEALVAQMTLEEKVGLCSGEDYWTLKAIKRLNLQSISMMDGPHGLRKQIGESDNLGIGESEPSVCYPTASALACSYNPDLLYRVGEALGEACLQEGVSVILGPGVNMKRSPLCGRNFEYFSEDPLVSGKLAGAIIRGIQSKGIGSSLKHFAVNNQEKRRMSVSAVVDERTLREYYLKAFEIAVKEGNPDTVMCSYNKINGVYASENDFLLKKVLREEWGYKGVTVSDWGAVHDRPLGVEAGLDLEMPGNQGYNDKKVLEAVKQGKLSQTALDQTAINVTALILKGMAHQESGFRYVPEKHHELAQEAACESGVLLKNDEALLPLNSQKKWAIIGGFAQQPRYQGAGSSKINPIKIDTPLEWFEHYNVDISYAQGYPLGGKGQSKEVSEQVLIEEAVELAKRSEGVCLFVGLTEGYESEGFDRENLKMPENQNRLIQAVTAVNDQVVVILSGGAPFEMPWHDQVRAILLMYLSGEGGGKAVVDLLLGHENPSGKLAETWPLALEDTPAYEDFPGMREEVLYKESLYVGYRYYDSYEKPVLFPFGYGMSYSTFAYSDFKVSVGEDEKINISYTIKNTGSVAGKETSFIFVHQCDSQFFNPVHQLLAFDKVTLEAQASKVISLSIPISDLRHFDVDSQSWQFESGDYIFSLGESSRSILDSEQVHLELKNTARQTRKSEAELKAYYEKNLVSQVALRHDMFEKLLGRSVNKTDQAVQKPFTKEHTLEDCQHTFMGKIVNLYAGKIAKEVTKEEPEQEGMILSTIREMPFFAMVASGDDMLSEEMMYGILDVLNGHIIRGIKHFI